MLELLFSGAEQDFHSLSFRECIRRNSIWGLPISSPLGAHALSRRVTRSNILVEQAGKYLLQVQRQKLTK